MTETKLKHCVTLECWSKINLHLLMKHCWKLLWWFWKNLNECYQKKKLLCTRRGFFEIQQISKNDYKMGSTANQGEVLRRGINPVYLSSSDEWKPCHGAINSWPCNLRTALEKYFRFQWNCKQLRIEARNSMANSEIFFSIFSETIHTILKIYSQYDLRKVR